MGMVSRFCLGYDTSAIITIVLILVGCQTEPSPPLSPVQSLQSFQLDPQLRIELVAAEPLVQDPVAITFDEKGRLWVVEMRGFMPDIDGTGEDQPVGRVNILTDVDGDGRMDEGTIFLDSLVLPRAIALIKGGALIAEDQPLWFAKDTTGDDRADYQILVDSNYAMKGIVEHSPNGLWRGLDNWYYNAKSDQRYQFRGGKWVKEQTKFRGQWGISHDDVGRLFYNYNWSQIHADLAPPNYLEANPNHSPSTGIDHGLSLDRSIYPARPNPAANRGYLPSTLNAEGKLVEFTSACSPLVYRGDLLPVAFQGNVFVCEPTANLIRRNVVDEADAILTSMNPYNQSEFLRSTDERFRPVALANGPDGALYIADMYRGVIQHGLYMSPYLREITLQRRLDQHINMGRIWRVTGVDSQQKRILPAESIPDLVALLAEPNGWYRDVGQRLLIERQDLQAVSLLEDLIETSENALATVHALWTLEGLHALTPRMVFTAISSDFPEVRSTGIRLGEMYAEMDPSVAAKFSQLLWKGVMDDDTNTDLQTVLSARVLPESNRLELLKELMTRHNESALFRDAAMSSIKDLEYSFLRLLLSDPKWSEEHVGKSIFLELLASAMINKGNAGEIQNTLSWIAGSAVPEWHSKAIIQGITHHARTIPVTLNASPMIVTDPQINERFGEGVFDPLVEVLIWPGKKKSVEPPASTSPSHSHDREMISVGRQQYLTHCASCHGRGGNGLKRFGPPLTRSEWVSGDPTKLVLIMLHGMQGPVTVDGVRYTVPDIQPMMPSFSIVHDREIAAILTYIRYEWGDAAGAISSRMVGRIRVMTQGSIEPWTEEQLLKTEFDLQPPGD